MRVLRGPREAWPPLRAAALLLCPVLAAGCGAPRRITYGCPPGMRLVPGGPFRYGDKDVPRRPGEDDRIGRDRATKETIGAFCIDRYEFPNREGAEPARDVTWLEAASRCRELGKRLCTEYEWEKACRGPKGLLFPWGNHFDRSVCALDADAASAHRSGARPGCVSGYGVYDMAGSVGEWTANAWDGTESDRAVRGGWERPFSHREARCSFRARRDGGAREPGLGFRCCADPASDRREPPGLVP